MTRISIKNNCKGIIKYFNKARSTGLVRMEDGSEFYINRRHEGDGDRFDKGQKVKFSLHIADKGSTQIMDLRPA
ncbi:MAG: hypothetical protein AAGD13_01610 [Pseudomonadota bacterium]